MPRAALWPAFAGAAFALLLLALAVIVWRDLIGIVLAVLLLLLSVQEDQAGTIGGGAGVTLALLLAWPGLVAVAMATVLLLMFAMMLLWQ